MDASSALRRAKNVFYPPTLRIIGPPSSQADATPKALEFGEAAPPSTLPTTTKPSKKADQASTVGKEKEPAKEKAFEPVKLLLGPKESSKEKGATQSQASGLAKLPLMTKEVSKGKDATPAKTPKTFAQPVVKDDPPPSKTN